jgi:hypothetical protein
MTAQDEKEIEEWFFGKERGYLATLEKYNIKPKNLYNFDETGFRVGCPRGVEVIVPLDVKEVRKRVDFERFIYTDLI